jgi:hypothetical protein
MATPKLLHLRSQTKGQLPSAAAIQVGQIGVNYHADDPFLCIKDSAGVVRRVSGFPIGTVAPTSASAGQLWVDTTNTPATLKVYNGTGWTPIPDAATTTKAGVVQLATTADVTAGTVGRAVDAAQLKATNDRLTTTTTASITGVTGTLPVTAVTTTGKVVVGVNDATTTTAGLLTALDKVKLNGIATGAEVNVQADWTQTDNTKDDFIKNKPAAYVLPAASATVLGGVKQGTGIAIAADGTLSVNLTGGLTYKGTTDPTKAPPAAPKNGDVWIASAAGAYEATWGLTGIATKGELLIFEGGAWAAVGQAASPIKPNWTAAAGAADEILNKPVAATDATAGLIRLATTAEAAAGTSTVTAVTPAQLLSRLPKGTAADQYLRWDQATTVWVAADDVLGGVF